MRCAAQTVGVLDFPRIVVTPKELHNNEDTNTSSGAEFIMISKIELTKKNDFFREGLESM